VLVILVEKTLIITLIRPLEYAETLFDILVPVPYVLSAVHPFVMPEPVNFIVNPITNVLGTISPSIKSKPIFNPFIIFALVAASIWPDFETLSMLFICKPLPFVNSSCHVTEFSEAVCLSKDPITIVNLAGNV
jgi:hypothetical protein